jgi:regulator of chromosome condensation
MIIIIIKIEPVKNAKVVGCGSFHSLVVIGGDLGGLFTCGLNNYGQLGIGSIETEYLLSKVSLPLSSESIVSVKGGMHHSLVLSSHGKVFAFGRGDSCQLGIASMSQAGGGQAGECSTVPLYVPLPDPKAEVVDISCGGFSLILDFFFCIFFILFLFF